jgi:taurine dioxygenase
MEITKLQDNIGAEVTGVDLREPLDMETRQVIYDAVPEHIAVVIRDQDFTPDEFLEATELFGEAMQQHHTEFALQSSPLVNEISNQHKDKNGKRVNHGETWHTDHPNHAIPPKFTTLYGVAVPSIGGDTEVLNTRAGFALLPDDIKARIRDFKTANVYQGSATRHRFAYAGSAQAERQPDPVVQPLVRTNGDNGTQALYFSTTKCENILGMTPEDSQDLLEDLLARIAKPELIYKHKWRKGDMLIWDNRSAMHQGVIDCPPEQVRLLYRIIIEGEAPH